MVRAKKEEAPRFPEFRRAFLELMGDMTLQEFADKLGMSRATVGFYAAGKRIPDALGIKQIAESCNVSTDYLLGLTKDNSPQARAVDVLGISSTALNNLLGISNNFPGILTELFSDIGFLGLVSTIYRLKSEVCATKQAHAVVHKIGLHRHYDAVRELKTVKSELEDLLGYPVSLVEPRHALYYCLNDVKMSAEGLAKSISGYDNLSTAEIMDHLYDFTPEEIKAFFKHADEQ